MNINHYPPVSVVGEPEPGQFRIGPHTDFGTVTVLDREPSAGGLQVYSDAEGWKTPPGEPGRSRSISVTCWSIGVGGAGRRDGIGSCLRSRTPPRRTSSR